MSLWLSGSAGVCVCVCVCTGYGEHAWQRGVCVCADSACSCVSSSACMQFNTRGERRPGGRQARGRAEGTEAQRLCYDRLCCSLHQRCWAAACGRRKRRGSSGGGDARSDGGESAGGTGARERHACVRREGAERVGEAMSASSREWTPPNDGIVTRREEENKKKG